jgi:hypothetical protein
LLEEDGELVAAMSRLAADERLRHDLGAAGHAYWSREHALELMAEDYRRVMADAVTLEAPHVEGLPSHFTEDHTSLVRELSEQMGVAFDLLA